MSISELTMNEGEAFEVRHPLARPRLQTVIEGESRTHQSFHDETRISTIYARFTRTGDLGIAERKAKAQYGDVSELNQDLTVLHSRAQETKEQFRQDLEVAAAKKGKKDAGAPAGSSQEAAPAPVAPPPATTPAPDVEKGA